MNGHCRLETLARSRRIMKESTGVVHDDVRDAAARDLGASRRYGFEIGHVAHDHFVLAAEFVGDATSSLGVTTYEHDRGAKCCGTFGSRSSDSRSRTSHDDPLVGECILRERFPGGLTRPQRVSETRETADDAGVEQAISE